MNVIPCDKNSFVNCEIEVLLPKVFMVSLSDQAKKKGDLVEAKECFSTSFFCRKLK